MAHEEADRGTDVTQETTVRGTDVAQQPTAEPQPMIHKTLRVNAQLATRIEDLRTEGETSAEAWRRVLVTGTEALERGTDVAQDDASCGTRVAQDQDDRGTGVAQQPTDVARDETVTLLREQLADVKAVRDRLLTQVDELTKALADAEKATAVLALAAPRKRGRIRAWLEAHTGR